MNEDNEYKTMRGKTYIIKKFPHIDGEYVKRLRKKLGLTQTMFAALLRVSNKAVEKWEQGANPVTNGNAVAMVLFDQNPELVKIFIGVEDGICEPNFEQASNESTEITPELKLAKAK